MLHNASEFPRFDDCFPELNRFILDLVADYETGNIGTWDDLDGQVKAYFTPERMEHVETLVPGWQKMASYTDGITLVHVMCVFLGMFMLPEFKSLTPTQQQMAKWIILCHDIDKVHIPGKKDPMHAFRSGAHAGKIFPGFGFPSRPRFEERIDWWSEYTRGAFTQSDPAAAPKPDNRKLPYILIGIDNLFGQNTPAALITKTVLLHISPNVDPNYPTPAPLTDAEIKRYIHSSLLPLLRVMMLSDNEGWSLFDLETRAQQRRDTLTAFERFAQIISA